MVTCGAISKNAILIAACYLAASVGDCCTEHKWIATLGDHGLSRFNDAQLLPRVEWRGFRLFFSLRYEKQQNATKQNGSNDDRDVRRSEITGFLVGGHPVSMRVLGIVF